METYYVVKYAGPFGFIKPWTAVRDGLTFSQQFLTPSTIEGIRQLLGVKKILRHKLSYVGLDQQQERIQSPGWSEKKVAGKKGLKVLSRSQGIIDRGVLLDPHLHLAFSNQEDADIAARHHICLSRNEDLLFPTASSVMTKVDFDQLTGFELHFVQHPEEGFLVGYNRYENGKSMYGRLEMIGEASTRQS